MADEAPAPQNLGEPGECGSDANFFAVILNSDNNNCFSPTFCASDDHDVLPDDFDDKRKPAANNTHDCASSVSLDQVANDDLHDSNDDNVF